MKKLHLFLLAGTFTLFFSCKDDDKIDDYANADTANEWIENIMRDNYYWYGDIPAKQSLNFQAAPDDFFISLLSSKDGKAGEHYYSTIRNKNNSLRSSSTNNLSFGFEYQAYYSQQVNQYALMVLYVLPDSPASRNNVKRGDWILTINDRPVSSNWSEEMTSYTNLRLGLAESFYGPVSKTSALNAEAILDNPVFLDTVYHYNNKNIGYLVYNHFTQGINVNDSKDETFNNFLRRSFSEFKSQSVDEFILDLRYNGGGQVTSAQLLATALAPSSAMGDIFCKITYNDKKSSKNYNLLFDEQYMKQNIAGENLNLKRLFIITSDRTASASEAVINGLRPFWGNNLIIVGDQTEGKNVGSITYSDTRFEWELHPIVCKISNKEDFSDYENGFLPNIELIEPSSHLYDLGDTNEYILNKLLYLIINDNSFNNIRNTPETENDLLEIGSSLDRKKTNGVILSHE